MPGADTFCYCSAGVVVLTSAGNDYRADACSYSPASVNQVITVGATDIQDRVASYSNVGSCLTVFAPGTGILSAGSDGDTAEKTLSGTFCSVIVLLVTLVVNVNFMPVSLILSCIACKPSSRRGSHLRAIRASLEECDDTLHVPVWYAAPTFLRRVECSFVPLPHATVSSWHTVQTRLDRS